MGEGDSTCTMMSTGQSKRRDHNGMMRTRLLDDEDDENDEVMTCTEKATMRMMMGR